MEDITDVHYRHAKKYIMSLNNLGDFHDLCVQNFKNKCIQIHELDPAHFLSAPRLAWQACLKKTGIKLVLTDVHMLLMVEKGAREGICHEIHRYAKANNQYMKNYDKNKGPSYIQYLDANNLYVWAKSKKLRANGFKWKKIPLHLMKTL